MSCPVKFDLPVMRQIVMLILAWVMLTFGVIPSGFTEIENCDRQKMSKMLKDGDIREGLFLSRKKMHGSADPFWSEQFAIFSIHMGRVNRRVLRAAKSAVQGAKDKEHALSTLALVFAVGEKPKEATSVAREVLKRDKNDARALIALGFALQQQGNRGSAEKKVLNAVTAGAGDPDVMYLAIKFYEKKNSSKDVLNTLELWTERSPDCAYAHYLKGATYYKSLALSSAATELKKAIEINPDYWYAQKEYAYILTYQKKFKEAIPIFESILSRQRGYGGTYIHFAECLEACNRKGEAIENYSAAIERICSVKNPVDQIERISQLSSNRQNWAVKALANRARVLMETGEYKKALHDATLLTSMFPEKMEPRYIKMLVLIKMQKYREALQEANFLIDREKDISLFYRKRAEIHKGLNQTESARKDIELAERVERTGSIEDAGE